MCWLWRSPFLNGDDRFVLFILVWLVGFLLCQDLRLTASEKHLNRFRQIFDQMESIGTLNRLGSAFACCCGIFPPLDHDSPPSDRAAGASTERQFPTGGQVKGPPPGDFPGSQG
jgi:hypothetical protein